jgi:hypothetical protein
MDAFSSWEAIHTKGLTAALSGYLLDLQAIFADVYAEARSDEEIEINARYSPMLYWTETRYFLW